jgi:hypothetical protein
MDVKESQVVFTPGNEPYLGRALLFEFDQLICSAMEVNAEIAPTSHGRPLTEHQKMACQVIAQSLSIALSIRELIRQGYLFGGHVLVRALAERAAILLYLRLYPAEIDKWNRGWEHIEAPSLAKMFERIQAKHEPDSPIRGGDLTAPMNSLLHAKPDSAPWNTVALRNGKSGHAVSKILNRPELCDELCANSAPWLAVVLCMMAAYFAEDQTVTPNAKTPRSEHNGTESCQTDSL